jgi:hypothetical protein
VVKDWFVPWVCAVSTAPVGADRPFGVSAEVHPQLVENVLAMLEGSPRRSTTLYSQQSALYWDRSRLQRHQTTLYRQQSPLQHQKTILQRQRSPLYRRQSPLHHQQSPLWRRQRFLCRRRNAPVARSSKRPVERR